MIHLRPTRREPHALLPCLLLACAAAAAQPRISLVDAVKQTVALHPDVRVRQADVAIARGDLEEARGRFDTRLSTGYQTRQSEDPQFQQLGLAQSLFFTSERDTSAFTAELEKQLRSGLVLQPRIQVDRSAETLVGLTPTGDEGRIALPGQGRTVVSLQITQPLARGRGRDAATALERAAAIAVDASTATLRHAVAAAVLRTITSYWNYVAATRRLEIVRTAESRAETMLEETAAAIGADIQPESDLKLVQATLANRRATRIDAEQALLSARSDLLLATGRDAADAAAIGPPADQVLDPGSAAVAGPLDEALVALGLARRADLAAARESVSRVEALTTAARDGIRPDIALSVDAGYVRLEDRSPLNPLPQLEGFNVIASLVYRFAPANRVARGQLSRTEATARQSRVGVADLERTIRANIAVAWSAVQAGAARVQHAREASALYFSTVEDERMKLQLGLATVLDLIVTEDRMVQSLLDEVSAEATYSSAVAQLRFETGTLPSDDGDITFESLTSIPDVGGP